MAGLEPANHEQPILFDEAGETFGLSQVPPRQRGRAQVEATA